MQQDAEKKGKPFHHYIMSFQSIPKLDLRKMYLQLFYSYILVSFFIKREEKNNILYIGLNGWQQKHYIVALIQKQFKTYRKKVRRGDQQEVHMNHDVIWVQLTEHTVNI